jgi:hypothetical protein
MNASTHLVPSTLSFDQRNFLRREWVIAMNRFPYYEQHRDQAAVLYDMASL